MTGRIKVRITAARVRGSPGAVLTITLGLHFTDAGTDLKFPNENMPWRYILAQYWYIFGTLCSPCWWCGGSLPLGRAQSNAHLGDSPLARASHCIMRTNLYTRGFFNVHQSKHGTTICTRILFYNLQKQSSQEPRSLHQQLSSDHQTNNFT